MRMVHIFLSEDMPGKFQITGQNLVPGPYLPSKETKKIIFLMDKDVFSSYQIELSVLTPYFKRLIEDFAIFNDENNTGEL